MKRIKDLQLNGLHEYYGQYAGTMYVAKNYRRYYLFVTGSR